MSAGGAETRVCVLTPPGRGAVAVIAVAGSHATDAVDACFLAKNRRHLREQPIGRILYGHWGPGGEDLVVCRRAADAVEVTCHGGTQPVATVVQGLVAAGCREISWPEWTARRFDCPLTCEAQGALAEAPSARTARILLAQFHGALRREAVAILAAVQSADWAAARNRLDSLLASADAGLHLCQPWQVVIAGRPNVGKSSLINAIVGYHRAIVFDQPGTTRDVVSTSTVIEGWPVLLSDTAGLHATTDPVEAAGIAGAHAQLAAAELVVWVEDMQSPGLDWHSDWRGLLSRQAREFDITLPSRQILVLNKQDRCPQLPSLPDGVLGTSAVTGQGIASLLAAIAQQLVPAPPAEGAAVPFTPRQVALLRSADSACEQRDAESAVSALEQLLSDKPAVALRQ